MQSSLHIPKGYGGTDIRTVIEQIQESQKVTAKIPEEPMEERSKLSKDSLEYLYGIYRKRARQIMPKDAIMPRAIFSIMMADVSQIDQGLATIEKFFEGLFESMLQASLEEKKE